MAEKTKGVGKEKTIRKLLIIFICCIGSFIWSVVFPDDSGEIGSVQNAEEEVIQSEPRIWKMCKMLAPRILLGIAGAVIFFPDKFFVSSCRKKTFCKQSNNFWTTTNLENYAIILLGRIVMDGSG